MVFLRIESRFNELTGRGGSVRIMQCDMCQKIFETKKAPSAFKGRETYCNLKCLHAALKKNNPAYVKTKQTCTEKHGTYEEYQIKKHEKMKETNIERYGTEYAWSSSPVKEKIKETHQKKYNVDHVSQIQDVKEKKKQTYIKNWGVESPLQSPEIMQKKNETCIEKFGTAFPTQLSEIQQLIISNNMQKYGVPNTTQLKETQKKMQQTCLERYGERFYSQTDEWIEKFRCSSVHEQGYAFFTDESIFYRSSYERRFIQWCDAHAFEIKKIECNKKFAYSIDGKDKRYFADFLIEYNDNTRVIYEIKASPIVEFEVTKAKAEAARSQLHLYNAIDYIFITENELELLENDW